MTLVEERPNELAEVLADMRAHKVTPLDLAGRTAYQVLRQTELAYAPYQPSDAKLAAEMDATHKWAQKIRCRLVAERAITLFLSRSDPTGINPAIERGTRRLKSHRIGLSRRVDPDEDTNPDDAPKVHRDPRFFNNDTYVGIVLIDGWLLYVGEPEQRISERFFWPEHGLNVAHDREWWLQRRRRRDRSRRRNRLGVLHLHSVRSDIQAAEAFSAPQIPRGLPANLRYA